MTTATAALRGPLRKRESNLWAREVNDFLTSSHKRLTESRGQPLPETLGMRVHPEICEWLMGLPVGWTEMLPSRQLEMPTLPQWQQSSGEPS